MTQFVQARSTGRSALRILRTSLVRLGAAAAVGAGALAGCGHYAPEIDDSERIRDEVERHEGAVLALPRELHGHNFYLSADLDRDVSRINFSSNASAPGRDVAIVCVERDPARPLCGSDATDDTPILREAGGTFITITFDTGEQSSTPPAERAHWSSVPFVTTVDEVRWSS